jgi:hypothetical protein
MDVHEKELRERTCKPMKTDEYKIEGNDNAETQRKLSRRDTPPRVFLQKRVQDVEKKGLESQKERQERRKNLQEYENNEFTTEATEDAEKAGG